MLCQVCGVQNGNEREFCRRCHNKLLVISGPFTAEDVENFESAPEEQFSLDEHLLERISILEEVVRRTTDSLRQTLGTLYKLEQKILVNQTGITTVRDLLEGKGVLGHEEWSELWENRMDYQLLALEKRERFSAVQEQIAALYQGDQVETFGHLLQQAEMALAALDMGAGVEVLEKAHELDPSNYELSFFLAEIFFNDGQIEPALVYFERVLATKGNHFESLVYCGVLHHERGNDGRAEELLRRAVQLFPDSFLPSFSLGAVYASGGRLQQAVVFLEKAVAIDPIPQAFFLLGSCCYEMGKTSAAIRRLEETLRLDPTFAGAHHLLGLAYLDRRWHRKAQTVLGEGHRLTPNRLRYRELVRLLGDPPGGEGTAHQGHERLAEAEDFLHRGQRRDALSAYRRVVAEEPDNPTLLVAYAMACLELGRSQEIEGVVEKVVGLEPQEPLRVAAYATLMEAMRSQGRYREGLKVGQHLLDEGCSDEGRSIACYEMAWNLAEMEDADLEDALKLALQAVELAPPDLQDFPLAALGWVHYRRREFDQSVDCLRRSNHLGKSPRTMTQLGMALLAQGEQDQARHALRAARDMAQSAMVVEEQVFEVLKGSMR